MTIIFKLLKGRFHFSSFLKAFFLLLVVVLVPSLGYSETSILAKKEVEAFNKQWFKEVLENHWFPGATVSVVQGDQIVALQGLGVADIATGQKVDPNKTLFRVGSISKTMTALAALRMADQGVLDLDKDINTYLKEVQLPNFYDEYITTRDLLTHQGGFEELELFHMVFDHNADVDMKVEDIQSALVRTRKRSAARYYDNLGFGLLGYLLHEIDGRPFKEIMDSEVFQPLNMPNTVVGLPDNRRLDAAKCYFLGVSGKAEPCQQDLLGTLVQSAGDISTTAADMANYMIALLQLELFLKPDTADQMMSFEGRRIHSQMPGLGLSIFEDEFANSRCRGHGGGIEGFASYFCLFPGQEVGVFVSVMGNYGEGPPLSISDFIRQITAEKPPEEMVSLSSAQLVNNFMDAFAHRFIPLQKRSTDEAHVANANTGNLTGIYFRDDTSRNLWGKILPLLSVTKVTSMDDGTLMIDGEGPYIEKSPLYYERLSMEGDIEKISKVAFKLSDNEVLMAKSSYGILLKQPWYKSLPWTLYPLGLFSVMLLVGLIYSLCGKRAAYKKIIFIAGGSFVLFILGLLFELEYAYLAHQGKVSQAVATAWRLLFVVSTAGFVYFIVKFPVFWWQKVTSNIGGKLFFSSFFLLMYLASIYMVWLTIRWNLLFAFT